MGHPPRLGRPSHGEMRALTSNEAVATGLTRSAVVFAVNESFLLFRSLGKEGMRYCWKLVSFDEQPEAYTGLIQFWENG